MKCWTQGRKENMGNQLGDPRWDEPFAQFFRSSWPSSEGQANWTAYHSDIQVCIYNITYNSNYLYIYTYKYIYIIHTYRDVLCIYIYYAMYVFIYSFFSVQICSYGKPWDTSRNDVRRLEDSAPLFLRWWSRENPGCWEWLAQQCGR